MSLLSLMLLADSCAALAQPKRLPAVDVVLDSAALVARLQGADSLPQGVIVSVLPAGPPTGHLVDGSAPAPAAVRHVLASLRPAARSAPAAFRVLLGGGPAPTITLDRSVLCRPHSVLPGSGETVRVDFGRGSSSGAGPGMGINRPKSVTPRFRLSASGAVEDVSLGAGTGFPDVDRAIREHLFAQRFHPARLDGRPVAVWMSGNKVDLIP